MESGTLTVLAPTNAAISALPGGDEIINDPVAAAELVNAHLVSGSLDTEMIFASSTLSTQGGQQLVIDPTARTITGPSGNAATITTPDEQGTNGYVHGVTAVLFAPAAPTPPTEPPPPTEPTAITAPATLPPSEPTTPG